MEDDESEEEVQQVMMMQELDLQPWEDKPKNIGCFPIDGVDPNVYSLKVPTAPFSFVDKNKNAWASDCMPPTYLQYEQLKLKPKTKEEVFNGLSLTKDGGIKCVDRHLLDKQKGVVKDVLAQAAKNVFSGKSVVGISLPVRVFEPRSLIERLIDWYNFAPIYIQ